MDIRSRLAQLFGTKNSPTTSYTGTWDVAGGPTNSYQERNALEANREWVGIAVDLVAKSAGAVRLKVMQYKNQEDAEVFTGPLYDFIEQPGQNLTITDFVYLNTVYKELTGNAFWYREKPSRHLEPILPTSIRPILDDTKTRLLRYEQFAGGKSRHLELDDVLHDRYIDPARPYWGAGKLAKIAPWVDTSTYATEFLRRFFLNGATFGGFIETEEESQERIKLIKAGLQNDHVGVNNAHKIGILPKGSKFTQTVANMQQIEMGATDDRYRDKILSAFGVPKSMVGLVQDVNRANAEANEYLFAQHTIKPIILDLIDFLNLHVAKELDPAGQYYFSFDEFVPTNMDIELREREIALNRQPYKTVNEVRAEQGLPPVDGGDVVYGPPFQSPLGSSFNFDNQPAAPAPVKSNPPSRSAYSRIRKVVQKEKNRDALAEKLAEKAIEREANRTTEELDAIAHRSFVGRVESYLDRVGEAVRGFNNKQKQQVLQDISRITKAVSKDDLFDMDQSIAAMVDFVSPVLRGLMTEQAFAEYEAQGFEGSFDSGDQMLEKIVDRETERLAKAYNATTANLLKNTLDQGIREGDGLAELTERVQQVYEFSDATRAKAVAHTEAFHIANQGNLEAYRQSGVVQSQRWYTAEDEMVCPYCQPMNGTVIGLNDVYFEKGSTMIGSDGKPLQLNYRAIDAPPLHTNCRCFIRPDTISID